MVQFQRYLCLDVFDRVLVAFLDFYDRVVSFLRRHAEAFFED